MASLPASGNLIAAAADFTTRMVAAVNAMMLDVLAAVARQPEVERMTDANGVDPGTVDGTVWARASPVPRHPSL